MPTYEPLGLLMLLPILYRLFPERAAGVSDTTTGAANTASAASRPILPLSPPLTPPLTPEETVVLTKHAAYDTPNTYLTPEALALPERQCTLCLEPRGTGEGSGGTVGVTECGHIFCWGCLGGLEKVRRANERNRSSVADMQPECPLCRQSLRMERLIPAYNL